jgi:hypothetical protein
MTTPNSPILEKLPHDFVKAYIENGQAKMTTWLPMPWSEMDGHQKDMANWYVKHKATYSAQIEVGWHIIATHYLNNGDQGITIKEADKILEYWTKNGDPCNPEPIGVQMFHG